MFCRSVRVIAAAQEDTSTGTMRSKVNHGYNNIHPQLFNGPLSPHIKFAKGSHVKT